MPQAKTSCFVLWQRNLYMQIDPSPLEYLPHKKIQVAAGSLGFSEHLPSLTLMFPSIPTHLFNTRSPEHWLPPNKRRGRDEKRGNTALGDQVCVLGDWDWHSQAQPPVLVPGISESFPRSLKPSLKTFGVLYKDPSCSVSWEKKHFESVNLRHRIRNKVQTLCSKCWDP